MYEPQKDLGNIWNKQFIYFYYLDTSVLLENIPLVKFIKYVKHASFKVA